MESQNDNPFATSRRPVDKSLALSLMKIQLGYFASAVACFVIAFLLTGFEFAGIVVLIVFMGPLLSLVETVHGVYKAVFLTFVMALILSTWM